MSERWSLQSNNFYRSRNDGLLARIVLGFHLAGPGMFPHCALYVLVVLVMSADLCPKHYFLPKRNGGSEHCYPLS